MEEDVEEEDAAHFDSLHDILNEKSPRNKNLKQQEDKESPQKAAKSVAKLQPDASNNATKQQIEKKKTVVEKKHPKTTS